MPATVAQLIEKIRTIGKTYPNKILHDELHKNIAHDLCLYSLPNNLSDTQARQELKEYLIFQYLRLENFKGFLATNITLLLKTEFNVPTEEIKPFLTKNYIVIEKAYLIQNIRSKLLRHYLEELTTSNDIKKLSAEKTAELKELIKAEPAPQQSDVVKRWEALLSIYSCLNDNADTIAKHMRRPIENVLGIKMALEHTSVSGGSMVSFEISPSRSVQMVYHAISPIVKNALKNNVMKEMSTGRHSVTADEKDEDENTTGLGRSKTM